MKKIITKLCPFIFTIFLVFASTNTFANIPVIDVTAIATMIAKSMQSIQQLVNMLNALGKQFNLSGNVGNSEIQEMQNDAANTIVRLTENQDSLFNQNLKMQSRPAFDACSTYDVSEALNNDLCTYMSGVTQSVHGSDYNALGGNPNQTNFENQQEAVHNVITTQNNLVQQTGDPTAGVSGATFLNPQLGGYENETRNNEATFYRKLLLGPLPAKHIDPRLAKSNPYLAQKLKIQQESYAARKSIAATSLAIYQQMYTKGPNGVSPMGMLEKFVKDRYGNPQWIKNITNTNPDRYKNKNDFTTPSQVIRSIAESDSFGNYVGLKIYQSNLRQEALLSVISILMQKEANLSQGKTLNS